MGGANVKQRNNRYVEDTIILLNESDDVVKAYVSYQNGEKTKPITTELILTHENVRVNIPDYAQNVSIVLFSYNQKLGWAEISTVKRNEIVDNMIVVFGDKCNQRILTGNEWRENGSFTYYQLELSSSNSGVVKLYVHYEVNGKSYVKDTGSVTGGISKSAFIPSEASQIYVEVKYLDFFKWKRIYEESLSVNNSTCYLAYFSGKEYKVKKVECS